MPKHTWSLLVCLVLLASTCLLSLTSCSEANHFTDDTTKSGSSAVTTEPPREYLSEYPMIGGIPTMYIDLENGFPLNEVNKNDYVDADCTLIGNNAGEDILSAKLELKGRGNYSWELDKKPYAIKFSEKQRLLGMGSAKKWVLIANYSDKTLMRNYLTLNLGKAMGMPFTSECRYVNLVVNGEYQGLYLLTEKIEIHNDRVDIDIDQGGVLLEVDPAYRHEYQCDYCIEVKSGLHFLIHEPEVDDYGKQYMKKVKDRVRELLTNVEGSLTKGIDVYSRYLDVDSFVDWYILNEFVKNHDSALYTSCYCYIGHDGKLYMGPVWDYDTCMGNQDIENCMDPTGYYIRNHAQSSWFVYLTRDKDFEARIKERWTELKNEGIILDMINSINDTVAYIEASEKLDVERWPEALHRTDLRKAHSLFTFSEEVDYMEQFLKIRYHWLNEKWYLGGS